MPGPRSPIARNLRDRTPRPARDLGRGRLVTRTCEANVSITVLGEFALEPLLEGSWAAAAQVLCCSQWLRADRKPVLNRDFWEQLLKLSEGRQISWQGVKGHAGNSLNEAVDTLASQAAHMAAVHRET